MSGYGEPKRRRVITHRGRGGESRRDTGRVEKPAITQQIIVEKPKLEKPAWMTDAQYEKTQQSLGLAVSKVSTITTDDKENETNNGNDTNLMASEDLNVKMKYLKNIKDEGKDEIVRNFYNTQTHTSRKSKRTESKIYQLRSFNNCIKYILINKYGKHDGTILELGCGKGGDLAKWEMINTRQYVGVDISDESIREAIKRYCNGQKSGRFEFGAVFATGDAFKTELPQILENFSMEEVCGLQFDNVSMQFCMHYAFGNETSVESMLTNVSRSLKSGGMFVGTIPNSDFISWKINKLAKTYKKGDTSVSWGNSIYNVTFPDLEGYDFEKKKFKTPFGNVYNYYLQDAVDNVPEYVVPFETFRGLCEKHGLELKYRKNFTDMFAKEVGEFFGQLPGPLVQSLQRIDGSYGLDGDEREAASFYVAFAFQKV